MFWDILKSEKKKEYNIEVVVRVGLTEIRRRGVGGGEGSRALE